jgi:phospholipid/cholesterol/gamma-HCH transport system substrate-binding protein
MRSVSLVGRIAAIGVVVVAIVVVAVLLFTGGGGYAVKADFLNAGQLVKGNQVQVAGVPVGSVDDISLTPNGQAEIKMSVKKPYAPLREGTLAVVRQASLSGIANRYVDLEMPPGDQHSSPTIPSGGTIDASHTKTAVDLDQLFNTFDPTTRKAVQEFLQNSAIQFQGKEAQAQLAYHYLNPALSTSSRLFSELNRDEPLLARFLIDSATLVNALAAKRDDLAALIGNLNSTFGALGSQKAALAEAVSRLPGFMRQANSTFVDLRSALNDVDPLVNASKPVAPKLNRLLTQLQPLARDAVPTVHDLSRIVHQPGPNNDLYDLEQSLPPLTSEALDTKRRSINFSQKINPPTAPNPFAAGGTSVGNVRGAFPEIAQALTDSAPVVAESRPYTTELLGWFDDFSTSGTYDAAGGSSRGLVVINAEDAFGSAAGPSGSLPGPLGILLKDRLSDLLVNTRTNQTNRCPGADEAPAPDGSNVLSAQMQQQLDCSESGRSVGPVH